jgi:hypothetical protein
MKNPDEFILGPVFAIATIPFFEKLLLLLISSWKYLSPFFPEMSPQIEVPPLPLFEGSPVYTI